MSEMLKLYVRGGFEFVDEDTGFVASDFGVSDNCLNERVTDKSLPAYGQEVEFVKESIERGVYKSAAQLAQAVPKMADVEKVEYAGDLSIGYYEMHITSAAPYGQSTRAKTEVGFGLEIIVKVESRDTVDETNVAHEVERIFKNDLSRQLSACIDQITVETRYI